MTMRRLAASLARLCFSILWASSSSSSSSSSAAPMEDDTVEPKDDPGERNRCAANAELVRMSFFLAFMLSSPKSTSCIVGDLAVRGEAGRGDRGEENTHDSLVSGSSADDEKDQDGLLLDDGEEDDAVADGDTSVGGSRSCSPSSPSPSPSPCSCCSLLFSSRCCRSLSGSRRRRRRRFARRCDKRRTRGDGSGGASSHILGCTATIRRTLSMNSSCAVDTIIVIAEYTACSSP